MHDWQEAEEHVARAEHLFAHGRGPEAERLLRQAIDIDPGRSEWHALLAMILESLGRIEESLASMLQSAALVAEDPRPRTAAAGLCMALQRWSEGLELVDRAIELGDPDERAYAIRITALHRLERLEEAELAYYEAQQRFEEMPYCLVAVGDLLADRGEKDRASWCFREAMRQSPNLVGLRSRIASLLASTGKLERALQLHLAELRENPTSIENLLESGRLLISLKRHPEAIDRFRRVLEIEPANIDAHWELGNTALAMRRFDDARVEFEVVRRLDPDTPLVRRRLAEALLGEGRLPEAREQLEAALLRIREEEPIEELSKLGDLLMSVDLSERALPLFERLSSMCHDDIDVLRRLAACRYRAQDRVGGIAMSRRILRRDPRCLRSLHNLALAAFEEGRFLSAFIWVRKGLAVDPADQGLRRIRSKIWTQLAWGWTVGLPSRALAWGRPLVRSIGRRFSRH